MTGEEDLGGGGLGGGVGDAGMEGKTDLPSGKRQRTLMRFLSLLNSSTARICSLIGFP